MAPGPSVNVDAELKNPCFKEQGQSYACLNDNNFDKEACQHHFDNYNACKKFWAKVTQERKNRGIFPHLPDVQDRAEIKENLLKTRQGK